MTCGIPAPGPSEAFTTVSVKHSDVPVWFHVYSIKNHPTRADSFSQGWGDTRFAPIHAEDGTWLHTYYAAGPAEALDAATYDWDWQRSPDRWADAITRTRTAATR